MNSNSCYLGAVFILPSDVGENIMLAAFETMDIEQGAIVVRSTIVQLLTKLREHT